jgi:hypothetical protein
MSSTASRIAGAEQRLRVLRPGLRVVSIRGGLQPGVADHAEIDGAPIVRQPDESSEAFRQRAIGIAQSTNAKLIVLGGLPRSCERDD